METAQEYRKYAEQCRRLAQQLEARRHRAILQEMSKVWLRLALEAEQKAR